MLESRAVDTDLACGVVCGQDALFAVTEKTVRYLQIASLQANACAIGVRYTHVLKDDAVHSSRAAAQDQRCLALASSAVEDDGSWLLRLECNPSGGLPHALPVSAGSHDSCAVTVPQRTEERRMGEGRDR